MRYALLLLVLVAGCGSRTRNQCAGTDPGHCVFGEKCHYDSARGCQICVCERPSNDENPRDPSDPTDPNPPFPQ